MLKNFIQKNILYKFNNKKTIGNLLLASFFILCFLNAPCFAETHSEAHTATLQQHNEIPLLDLQEFTDL